MLDVSARVHGVAISRTLAVLEPLLEGPLRPVPLDLGSARGAAEVRAGHYQRASRPISLADAVLIGSAGSRDRVATADPDVLAVTEAEGIDTEPLPQQG